MLPKICYDLKSSFPWLYRTLIGFALGSAVALVLILVDQRMLLGASVWVKPLKFQLSLAVFLASFGGILLYWQHPWAQAFAKHASWVALLEVAIISLQAGRGVPSHFNNDGIFNSVLYQLMGIAIAYNTVLLLIVWYSSLKKPALFALQRLWLSAIRLGLGASLIGSGIGAAIAPRTGHTIGAADGGPGLPLVGWSVVAGDLRVAHFLGLHGLQLMLGLAWLAMYWQLPLRRARVLLLFFFGLWLLATSHSFWQAWQGEAWLRFPRASNPL